LNKHDSVHDSKEHQTVTTKHQQAANAKQTREDTLCNLDYITVMTKILSELDTIGVTLKPHYIKIDQNSKKELKDKIDTFYRKTKLSPEDEEAEEETKENTVEILKKSKDILQIEDEYQGFTNMSLTIRRGRCNRIWTKYVEKAIFEDSEASDIEDNLPQSANDKKVLKKRKKKYLSMHEYLEK
jgi:hypothetical protein